jgi:16S rRNA (guanine966-N2)-methyltransferase
MKLKITGGEFRGRLIDAPKGSATRPTLEKLRKTLFDICQMTIEDATILDLFSGSGALGIEALSRNAQSVTFVESHKMAFDTIKSNLQLLKVTDKARLLPIDVFKALDRLDAENQSFDFIFIDPPYAKSKDEISLSEKVLLRLDTSSLTSENTRIFLEEGRHFNLDRTLEGLKRLQLKSKRDAGDSHLFEFNRI